MSLRAVSTFVVVCLASIVSVAQNTAPPTPERITIHSNVLNEDRAILVRMPAAAQGKRTDTLSSTWRTETVISMKSAPSLISLSPITDARR